ncbi:T9SS type A sorting domain-containing protein [candidate division WOR-3 bacterium]|nr:T9SS type A sorting domain-containing protein [candidate division WOR-3 bacterium]
MKEATGGFHFLPDRERAREEWERIKKEGSCKQAEFPLNEDGSLAPEYSLIDYLIKNKLVSTTGNTWYWNRQSGLPKNADDIRARIPELRPGDILEIDFGSERHSMTVVEVGPDGKVYVGGRNPKENRLDLCSRIQSNPEVLGMRMLHIPDKLGNCEQVQYTLTCDSTFKVMGVRHMWTCCWHENLAGQAPLTTKRSAYACLSWSENRGTTWDTLITPRLTFAGCSAVVMRQETYSSLLHGSNRTIEVRGSTNDGATWPHLIGSDSLTEASLPWATNQRNVRIAWIYKGPVQSGRYWCVDEIKFFAKPSRAHDMSVSEITSPRGVLTQGPDVTPTAYLWNHGCAGLESALVTMTIGVGYTNSRWVKLLAHSDTVLDFPQWTATPGNYTTTCFVALDDDECRANDTATLTFRVVADTWVKKYPVYAGGTVGGGCMTAVGTNELYCVTGKQNYFARYLVDQNLWKNLEVTPRSFSDGGSIAYAGGDYLYALRGHSTREFYRYRLSTGHWSRAADVPDKVGWGGALVYGGNGYLYALRGSVKKDFYRYSIAGNSWQSRAALPDNIGGGACLAWDGSDRIYALRGNNKRDFYEYRISTNQWTRKTSIPQDVSKGGALAFNPVGNKVYALCGDGTTCHYAYNPTNNTWSQRRSMPHTVRAGGSLAYCDYSLYATVGIGRDPDFYRYSPPVGGFEIEEPPTQVPVAPAVFSPGFPDPGELDVEEQITFDLTDKFNPQYSPSGLWIAYTALDTLLDCLEPFKIPVAGGTPQALAQDSLTHEQPRWDGSGDWLVTAADSGIYKVAADGSGAVLIAQGIVANPRWVSGDNRIAFERFDTIAGTHNPWLVSADGSGETCLVLSAEEYLQVQPISDTDFVCVKVKNGIAQLCRVLGGQETWLTSDYCENINPDLSPDREWVTYQKLDETGCWQVYKLRVNGAEESRFTETDNASHETPVFSPDGAYIAYSKWPSSGTGSPANSQICYKPVSGGPEQALNPADATRENPAWSPDCAFLIYQKTSSSSSGFGPEKKFRQLARSRTGIKGWQGLEGTGSTPKVFALYQNRPNPFRFSTSIRYAIPTLALVELTIYDIAGRAVTRLVSNQQKPGWYTAVWPGTDARGRRVGSGTYFYVLKADGRIAQKRMLLVR